MFETLKLVLNSITTMAQEATTTTTGRQVIPVSADELPLYVTLPLSTYLFNQVSEIESYQFFKYKSTHYIVRIFPTRKAYSIDLAEYMNYLSPLTKITTLEITQHEIIIELKNLKQ